MTDKNELVVNENRALEILGVKRSTLRALVRSGMLDPMRSDHGRIRQYYVSELLALRAARVRSRTLVFDLREEVMSVAAQVQNLSRDLRLMAQQIGLPHIGYAPTDVTLANLYRVALTVKGTTASTRPKIGRAHV
jgi:predicted site-specific integrase-resolvase